MMAYNCTMVAYDPLQLHDDLQLHDTLQLHGGSQLLSTPDFKADGTDVVDTVQRLATRIFRASLPHDPPCMTTLHAPPRMTTPHGSPHL